VKHRKIVGFFGSILSSTVGIVFCFIVGVIFLGLAIRVALNFPGDSIVPLLFVGIAISLYFAFSVFKAIRDD